jgi:PAS domain S-box-containing protein
MSDDRDRRSAVSSLGEARAAVVEAAKTPEIRRVLGPVIAEIDRALATLDPTAGGLFNLTPLAETAPPQRSNEVEALRREVERYRALADQERGLLETVLTQSPHGILVSDRHGKLILQNRAAERIWAGSATAENVEGWGRYRAFHDDGRPYEPGDWAMARALSAGETVDAEEVHFQRFDGTHGILLGSAAPVYGPDGSIVGAVSTFADITRFKHMERELRLRETWLSTTLRSIADAVIATDGEGRVVERGTPEVFRADAIGGEVPGGDPPVIAAIAAFKGLPFARRQLAAFDRGAVEATLRALQAARLLAGYPPLVDADGRRIAQAEHTVYVGNDGVEVLTG